MGGDEKVYTMGPDAFRVSATAASPPPAPEDTPDAALHGTSSRPARHTAAKTRQNRRRRGWDVALTIVLLVLLAAAAGVASFLALYLGYASDACSAGTCHADAFDLGIWVSLTSPWIAFVIGLALSIGLLVARRIAFWVPLVCFALIVGLWNVGSYLVWAATVSG